MLFLDLCRSSNFEQQCTAQCGQRGTFALISTTNPGSTPSRLNGGWIYYTGPRKGIQTPPLAYCYDWDVVASWRVGVNTDVKNFLHAVRQSFNRPCTIPFIEDRLMKDDKSSYPNLAAKGMSKNGLDNVFCLKPEFYTSREGARCGSEDEHQATLAALIVEQVQAVIDELSIEEGVEI